MTLEEMIAARSALVTEVKGVAANIKSANRNPDDAETKSLNAKMGEIRALDEKIQQAKDAKSAMDGIAALTGGATTNERKPSGEGEAKALTLGNHFVKHAGDELLSKSGERGATVSAPEWDAKAAGDTQVTGGNTGVYGPILTDVDRTVIAPPMRRLTVADLLGSGNIGGQAITYFVQGAFEGTYGWVAEGGNKPKMHFALPTTVTDALKKIAGYIDLTDEMIEDLPFVVSEIDGRLRYELALNEENALLAGDGAGQNLRGILNRSGIQAEASGSFDDNPDAIFRAMTKVTTGSGLDPDGIAIHPLDYQNLRLKKDANDQYLGGGYFQGQYGNGAILVQPPLWGLPTVVTPAVAQGTAIVGAWKQAGTVYRKGGVRVESSNSHADNFTTNKVTVRAEERLALAVRRPSAFVVVELEPTPV